MKNFYDLIKSQDIRDHCEKIGYVPDTLQCIELVYNSVKISLDKKHRLYKEIIETMPEPDLPDSAEKTDKTLYELLKEHIELEIAAAENFAKDMDKAVYRYNMWDNTDTTLLKAIDTARNDKNQGAPFTILNMTIGCSASFLADCSLCAVSLDDDFISVFCNYYIAPLPIPFKRGDVVCYDSHLQKNKPCIFDFTYCDDIDTFAKVYTCDIRTGYIMAESVAYYNLTYYKSGFYFSDQFIKVLSDYFQEKIDLATLLNTYAVHAQRISANELNDPNLIQKDYLTILFGKRANLSDSRFL